MTRVEFDTFERRGRRRAVCLGMRHGLDSDMAEDAAQEVMLQIWRNHKTIHPLGAGSYLERCIVNWCADRSRKAYVRRELRYGLIGELPDTLDPALDPALLMQAVILSEQMECAKAQLPMMFRVVLEMVADGASYRETGDALGVSEPTIKSRLHRARKRMRDAVSSGSRV